MTAPDSSVVSERESLVSWRSSKPAFASRVLLGLVLISGGINNFLARNPVPSVIPRLAIRLMLCGTASVAPITFHSRWMARR